MQIERLDHYENKKNIYKLGKEDLNLMANLILAGDEHSKFTRFIRINSIVNEKDFVELLKMTDGDLVWEQQKNTTDYNVQYSGQTALRLMNLNTSSSSKSDIITTLTSWFESFDHNVFVPNGIIEGMRLSRDSFNKSDSIIIEKKDIVRSFYNDKSIWYVYRISSPFYIWKHIDTYKKDTNALSASTMYTLVKQKLEQHMFEFPVSNLLKINKYIEKYNQAKNKEDRYIYSSLLFNELSSGFLQERILHLNVDSMKRMIKQRKNHIRREWQVITDLFENNISTMK